MAVQRVLRGYCERDVWNMDRWLCSVLAAMLHDLRVDGHGYEPVDEADWEEFGVTADMPEPERWERLLAHMEALLRLAQGESIPIPCADAYEAALMTWWNEHPDQGRSLALEDPEVHELGSRMVEEGRHVQAMEDLAVEQAMRLVGKYWSALWD